jgi:hypothetical protein
VPPSEPAQWLTPRIAVAAGAAFAVTLAWRFLTFTGFTNDHYAHVALAQQWLLGDRPVRDFVDPGWPLTYLLSAAAWRLGGDAMWIEWALTATALGIAAACTLIAAYRLSGSLAIAGLVTALEIVIFPRTYSYPKLVAYAAAACVLAAMAARPSWARIFAAAALTAAAFLLRHDHGLYIGIASAVCVAVVRSREGVRLRPASAKASARQARISGSHSFSGVAGLTVATAAFLLPWIVFVTLNGGLAAYFDTALEFARGEANASNLRSWPRITLVPGQPLAGLARPNRPLAQVAWTPETDAATRLALEARFRLEPVRQADEGYFYYVHDPSPANLEALDDDPHVAGTTGLGRVARPAWRELLATWSPLRLAPALHSAANADAWLFWLFWTLPLVAGALLGRRALKGVERWPGEVSLVSAVIVLALLVDAGFLRDILRTRFSDAIVPPALLGAWLLGLCWARWPAHRLRQHALRALSLVAIVITVAAITTVADTRERVSLTGVDEGVAGVERRAASVARLLAGPHRQTLAPPSRQAAALMPFFSYLDRCSSPADRIIVTGESPDVVVLSGRRFASDGAVFGAWYSSAVHQDRTLDQLKTRQALFVLLMDAAAFRTRFPLIDPYIQDAYRLMGTVPVDGAEPIPILVYRDRIPSGTDAMTGWPCFRSG